MKVDPQVVGALVNNLILVKVKSSGSALRRTVLTTLLLITELAIVVDHIYGQIIIGGILLDAQIITVYFSIGHVLLQNFFDQKRRFRVDDIFAVVIRIGQLGIDSLLDAYVIYYENKRRSKCQNSRNFLSFSFSFLFFLLNY
jgi:hypothetical protein